MHAKRAHLLINGVDSKASLDASDLFEGRGCWVAILDSAGCNVHSCYHCTNAFENSEKNSFLSLTGCELPSKRVTRRRARVVEVGHWLKSLTTPFTHIWTVSEFPFIGFDILMRWKSSRRSYIVAKEKDWHRVSALLSPLTAEELRQAEKDAKENKPIPSHSIHALFHTCRKIRTAMALSREKSSWMKACMFSNIVRFGIFMIWFTVNPAELSNPLLYKIARVRTSRAKKSLAGKCPLN